MTTLNEKQKKYQDALRLAERQLSRRDPLLRPLIKNFGQCELKLQTSYFELLVRAIIGQQLSTKVAETIYKRFTEIYDGKKCPKPEQVIPTPDDTLRATGMSFGKVSFIKDLAAKTADGTLKLHSLSRLSDDEVIEMLTTVKGIGVWTAHMFLIFSLGRLDVLPVGDLGIRKAVQNIYELDALPDAKEIESIAEKNRWSPYSSVASWYLWRSLG